MVDKTRPVHITAEHGADSGMDLHSLWSGYKDTPADVLDLVTVEQGAHIVTAQADRHAGKHRFQGTLANTSQPKQLCLQRADEHLQSWFDKLL